MSNKTITSSKKNSWKTIRVLKKYLIGHNSKSITSFSRENKISFTSNQNFLKYAK